MMNNQIKSFNAKSVLALFFGATVIGAAFIYNYNSSHFVNFTTTHTKNELESMYNNSQYVVSGSKKPISDAVFYAHASYEYILGSNPILINAEHPPIGKYLIGISQLLTGHWKTAGVIFAIGTYLLAATIIFQKTKSVFAIFIFTFFYVTDTNVRYQIAGGPLLDIIQLFFLIAFTISFEKATVAKNKFVGIVVSGILLGMLASSKMYFPTILVALAYSLQNLVQGYKKLNIVFVNLISIILIGVVVYIASYGAYFGIHDGTLVGFIKAQLYTIHYWTDNAVNDIKIFGAFIPLVFLNRYYVWWGKEPVISYEDWTLMWPISYALILLSIIYVMVSLRSNFSKLMTHRNPDLMLRLSVLVVVLSVYFLNIPISPRYLILLFVPGYMLIALASDEIIAKFQIFQR